MILPDLIERNGSKRMKCQLNAIRCVDAKTWLHRRLVSFLAISLMFHASSLVRGHGMPIQVEVVDGKLRVSGGVADTIGFAPQMFLDDSEDGQLDHLQLPNFGAVALTNLPGLDITGVTPGSGLSIVPVGRPAQRSDANEKRWLWFWDMDQRVTLAPNGESFQLATEFDLMKVEQKVAPNPSVIKFAEPLADELGEHVHYLRYLLDDDPTAAIGAYGIFVQITSPKYQASDPLLMMFGNGVSGPLLLEAAEDMNTSATRVGDYDRDEQLTIHDLDRLLDETRAVEPHRRFDVNHDEVVNQADGDYWVKSLKKTWIGDANLDGQFNSTDLISVFQVGVYERDQNAHWSSGDWDGDQRFGSRDLIVAFQDGGYEAGVRTALSAVPEPTIGCLLWSLVVVCGSRCAGKMSRYGMDG